MRYYFHVLYEDVAVIDDEGQGFESLDEAKGEAHRMIQELAAEALVRHSKWRVRGIRISSLDVHEVATITVDPLVEKFLMTRPPK